VAIEAMACRTPVVASKVGGLQFTVIPEVTGLLVPPQDETAFADAIDRILSNPAWGNHLGQMARQRVEIALSWDSVAARLSCLYNQLLSQSSATATKTSQIAA
jgi:glycosyltransferase involved in cell wall biosynthesis